MVDPEERAMKLLRSPYIFPEFLKAVRRAGLIGEQVNALIAYIVFTSRLLPDPLHLFVKGRSGSGKNFLVDNVAKFLPPSHVYTVSSTSANALNFEGKKLAHKVFYVKELNKLAGSMIQTRLIISEKELIREVTIRKKGGGFTRQRYVTKGPICSVSTTTKNDLEIDDERRRISCWTDVTAAQTYKIVKAAWGESDLKFTPEEQKAWHHLQQPLKERARIPIVFPNRFSALAKLAPTHLLLRSYAPAFKKACQTIRLIRSFRKPDQEIENKGELRVTFSDIAIGLIILGDAFAQSLYGLPEEDPVLEAVRRVSEANDGAPVRASDIATEMEISPDQAYSLLRDAAERNVVIRANRSQQKNLKLYLPAPQKAFLPDPKIIYKKLKIARRVRFVHPLTGEWVVYDRNSKNG